MFNSVNNPHFLQEFRCFVGFGPALWNPASGAK
jgi:hypothetical protein